MKVNENSYHAPATIFMDEVFDIVADTRMLTMIIEVSSDDKVIGYLSTVLPNPQHATAYSKSKAILVKLCSGLGNVARAFNMPRRKAKFRLVEELVGPDAPVYMWVNAVEMIEDLKLETAFRHGGSKWSQLTAVINSFKTGDRPKAPNLKIVKASSSFRPALSAFSTTLTNANL